MVKIRLCVLLRGKLQGPVSVGKKSYVLYYVVSSPNNLIFSLLSSPSLLGKHL